jgi:N6-L-threonylcarbamoyladenine synthase
MIIFSIETSCDDTSIAIIKTRGKKTPSFEILANIVSSQVKKHAEFGGVVPNLAARLHLENINFCIEKAFKKAKVTPKQIDLVAVTKGPGLIPALLIGVETAKNLAFLWQKPIIGVNHIEGHIYANWIMSRKSKVESRKSINFPILSLVVSGGHTSLILMKDHFKYQIIGETRDDAVGEAFDKVARLLNLGYPGGPIIEEMAKEYKGGLIDLPSPMINSNDYDFSFSGLKTAVMYETKKQKKLTKAFKNKMAASFQEAAFKVLIKKTIKAAKEYKVKTIMLGGGVSANKTLQNQLEKAVKKNIPNSQFLIPASNLSTDNAAMIGIAGYYRYINGFSDDWKKLKADANLKI